MPAQAIGLEGRRDDWLSALRGYLAVSSVAHLVWETLQLPLYTLWTTGDVREQTLAVLHCTGGDVLIATSTLTAALVAFGSAGWPSESFRRVLVCTVLLGVGYTIFSEWLNIVVRESWAYSPLMPVVPIINMGLSPLLQWMVIPVLALFLARLRMRVRHD